MTQPRAGAVHCPDCGREVPRGADLCECGYPLMFLRQEEPSAASLKPSRRPAQDDDTDELPVVVPDEPAPPVLPATVPAYSVARVDELVCGACGEVNTTSRTWCAQCGEPLRDRRPVTAVLAPVPAREPRPWGRVAAAVVGVLLVVGAVVLALLLLERRGDGGADEAGGVRPLEVASVTASSTAPPGQESRQAGGATVLYDAENVLDGRPETAWRTPGDGRGEALTFRFDEARVVTRVGLVPGYAKVDRGDDADRFEQNRRVTEVRWTFDGGTSYEQVIEAPEPSMTSVSLPEPVTTRAVVLQITGTTAATARDNTAISEVLLEGR